jgi:hypothetical protein
MMGVAMNHSGRGIRNGRDRVEPEVVVVLLGEGEEEVLCEDGRSDSVNEFISNESREREERWRVISAGEAGRLEEPAREMKRGLYLKPLSE